ncbi:hypothetical protein D3C72_1348780 [compost metagenome]
MLDGEQLGLGLRNFAAQRAFQCVRNAALQAGHGLALHFFGLQERLGNGIGIGAYQAAGTQLDAAKVPHHGGQRAFELLVAQHIEHGPAGSATGFAVVHRCRLAARQQGPAHMVGCGVFGAQALHDGLGLGTVCNRLHTANESAFLDQQVAMDGLRQCVGHRTRKEMFAYNMLASTRQQRHALDTYHCFNDGVHRRRRTASGKQG